MQSIMTAVMSLIAFLCFSTHRLFQRMPSKFSRTTTNVMIAKILFICTGIFSFPGLIVFPVSGRFYLIIINPQ